MRLRLVVGVVVFFIVAAVGLAGSMFGSGLSASRTSIAYSQTPVTSGTPIVLENAHLGTSAWKTPRGKEASTHRLVDCKSCHVDPEIGVLALDPLYGLDKTRLTAQKRLHQLGQYLISAPLSSSLQDMTMLIGRSLVRPGRRRLILSVMCCDVYAGK